MARSSTSSNRTSTVCCLDACLMFQQCAKLSKGGLFAKVLLATTLRQKVSFKLANLPPELEVGRLNH